MSLFLSPGPLVKVNISSINPAEEVVDMPARGIPFRFLPVFLICAAVL